MLATLASAALVLSPFLFAVLVVAAGDAIRAAARHARTRRTAR